MSGYLPTALDNIQYKYPAKAQHAPYPCPKPEYGSKVQLTDIPDDLANLLADQVTHIQKFVGKFY